MCGGHWLHWLWWSWCYSRLYQGISVDISYLSFHSYILIKFKTNTREFGDIMLMKLSSISRLVCRQHLKCLANSNVVPSATSNTPYIQVSSSNFISSAFANHKTYFYSSLSFSNDGTYTDKLTRWFLLFT